MTTSLVVVVNAANGAPANAVASGGDGQSKAERAQDFCHGRELRIAARRQRLVGIGAVEIGVAKSRLLRWS